MNYEELAWRPTCCGQHRKASIQISDEKVDLMERGGGGVYIQVIKGGDFSRGSAIVPNGQAVVSLEEAEAIVERHTAGLAAQVAA